MTLTQHPAARFSGPVRLDRPAQRIVSLLPSATEIVAALGLADRLVGVTHECDYPPEVEHLPRLTADAIRGVARSSREIDTAVRAALASGHGLYRLDDGALAVLEPDLILTQELCRVCAVSYATVVRAARMAGGGSDPLVVSLEPHRLDDVLATIELVAALCGEAERGARLVDALRRRLRAVPRPERATRVALVEWLDPLFAPGHWVPDQVAAAGGCSVFGSAAERSRESSWEVLASKRPEVIVLALCGFDLPQTLAECNRWRPPKVLRETPAWEQGQLWAIDGSAYVSRPGPRLVEGVEIMSAILTGRDDPRLVRLRQRLRGEPSLEPVLDKPVVLRV